MGVKEFEFDYYYFTKDPRHRETIVIKGMDGILYGFVKREKKVSDKVALFPSDDRIQADKNNPSDEEEYRTLKWVL
jgi:hypothetical protein